MKLTWMLCKACRKHARLHRGEHTFNASIVECEFEPCILCMYYKGDEKKDRRVHIYCAREINTK